MSVERKWKLGINFSEIMAPWRLSMTLRME
jgi:hypothetical protein